MADTTYEWVLKKGQGLVTEGKEREGIIYRQIKGQEQRPRDREALGPTRQREAVSYGWRAGGKVGRDGDEKERVAWARA